MSAPTQWQSRYTIASARLMNLTDVLAARDAITATSWEGGQPVAWLGDPPPIAPGARVGVLAGSFNPLTLAHTRLMRSAARCLRLTHTLWVISRATVEKEQVERASLADRLVQMRAYRDAQRRPAGIAVLEGGLYTDQAAALRTLLPPGTRLWMVAGFDKVAQIFDARYYSDREAALHQLFQSADLAIAPRGQRHGEDLRDLLGQPENRPYAQHVRLLPAQSEALNLSSTMARARAAHGATMDELAGHVEPEGAALVFATRAFGPVTALPAGELIDPYALRQELISHLASRPTPPRSDTFQRLWDRACAPTPAGARLRERLLREAGAR
jgi:nicotinamide-nucleotide adenylyltransferase